VVIPASRRPHGRGGGWIQGPPRLVAVASIGVLAKTGFTFIGPGSEDRVIRFERRRNSEAATP